MKNILILFLLLFCFTIFSNSLNSKFFGIYENQTGNILSIDSKYIQICTSKIEYYLDGKGGIFFYAGASRFDLKWAIDENQQIFLFIFKNYNKPISMFRKIESADI